VNDLKAMHAEGLSFSQIAQEIGGITRNAAIGKASRLGLAPRDKKTSSARPRVYPKHRRPPRVKWQPSIRLPKIEPEPMPAVVFDEAIPIEQRKTLMQLEHGNCRWPCGDPVDPGFFYCGGVAIEGKSYCIAHSHRAYQGFGRVRV
jgi:GcrA cell cycle regulator